MARKCRDPLGAEIYLHQQPHNQEKMGIIPCGHCQYTLRSRWAWTVKSSPYSLFAEFHHHCTSLHLHGWCFPGPSAQASSSFWNVLLSEASLSDTYTLLKPQCRAACPPQSLAFYAALITAEVSTYVCDVYFSTMNVGTEDLCASYTAPMPGTEQAWLPSESMWSE